MTIIVFEKSQFMITLESYIKQNDIIDFL